jgi:hypothetical protein
LWGRNLVEPGFERAVGILGDVQDEAKLAAVYFEGAVPVAGDVLGEGDR